MIYASQVSPRPVPDGKSAAGLAQVAIVVTTDDAGAIDSKVLDQIRGGLGIRHGRMGFGLGGGLS